MEKVPGIQLAEVWGKMDIEKHITIVKAIACFQKKWMSISFNQFGSLYYAADLDKASRCLSYTNCNGVTVTDPKFAVGPSTAREFYDDERSTIEFDKGPCKTVQGATWKTMNRQSAIVKVLAYGASLDCRNHE